MVKSRNPFLRASSTSAGEKSPSGPIRTIARFLPATGSRLSMIVVSSRFSPSLQWPISLAPSKAETASLFRNFESSTGSFSLGSTDFSDCLSADIITLSPLSVLKMRLSECSPITGVISSTPNSTAFSRNHSYLSRFLVGATAM